MATALRHVADLVYIPGPMDMQAFDRVAVDRKIAIVNPDVRIQPLSHRNLWAPKRDYAASTPAGIDAMFSVMRPRITGKPARCETVINVICAPNGMAQFFRCCVLQIARTWCFITH